MQDAVQRVFDLYPRLGSIGKVLAYLHRENLLFPHRVGGEVRWEPTSRAHIDVILRNPNYTGDYVYRRRKFTRMSGSRKPQIRSRHQSEWIATIGHHPAYVSHETWRRIQDSLAANRPAVRPPVGRGSALLQGLVWCHRCGRWMATTYQGRDGTVRYPSYQCRVRDRSERLIHPTTFPAKLIDQHVAARVLAALKPVDMQIAIQTIEEHQLEQNVIAKAKARRLQQAHDQVEALNRRHSLIDPQHKRLLARVEGDLERALADVDQLERQFAAEAAEAPPTLTPEDAADLVRLTTKIGQLWSAHTTTNEGRKRLLRAAISRVVVRDKTDETMDLEIVWVGGHTEHLQVLRSGGVNKLVGVLWDEGKNAPAILDELQARGITNRRGRPMSKLNVNRTLTRVGRSDSQRILTLIKQRHEAGESYRVIAEALNASGVRPMRAASFSAELVQALLHQSRVRAAKAQRQDVDCT